MGETQARKDGRGACLGPPCVDIGKTRLNLGDAVGVVGMLGQKGGAGPGEEGRNVDHFCLRVDPFDADAISAWLTAAGVDAEPPARRYGADGFGQSIYLQDPEGNTVELKGPPEP